MKIQFNLLLVLSLCVSMFACTSNDSKPDDSDSSDTEESSTTSAFCISLLEKCTKSTAKTFNIKGSDFTKEKLNEVDDEFGAKYLKSNELFSFYFSGEKNDMGGVSKVYYYGSMRPPEGVDCRLIFATHDSWEEFSQKLILVDFWEEGAKLKAIPLASYFAYVGEANTIATIMDNGNIKTVETVDIPGHEKNETIVYSNKLEIVEKK